MRRFVFIIAVTFGIFVLLFQRVPLSDVLNTIKEANLWIIVLTLGISMVSNILVPAYRWKLILEELRCPISWRECLLIKMGSDAIISLLPMRLGETSRLLYLKRVQKISYHKSVLSILGEYLLSILMLVVFLLMGGMLYWKAGNHFMLSNNILLVPAASLSFHLNKELSFLSYKWKRYFSRYLKWYLKYFSGILFNKKILLISFIFAISELINVYLISVAVNISVPLYAILLYVPLIVLIGSIPVTFLGFGIRESAVLFFFLRFASPEKVLSLGVLYSLIEHLMPMLIGLSLTGLFMHKMLSARWK